MAAHTDITKAAFKKDCSFHVFTGWSGRRIKHNVIYYQYAQGDGYRGYKYAVALDIVEGTKADLLEAFYQWVCNGVTLPHYIRYKYAIEDKDRFRPSLSLNF